MADGGAGGADELAADTSARIDPAELALLVSVFVVAACGLVYELAAGALASYLLGDSVLQFSTVIGTYLFAMGVGSWLSRHVERQLVANFLRIELLVGVIGGLMPAGLFAAHSVLPVSAVAEFRMLLYGMVLLIGTLVGLEIPLVMRILQRRFRERYALKDLVSQVLTFDYLGALVVSLAFPLIMVPQLGVVRTGIFFGLLNVLVAVWVCWQFRTELRAWRQHAVTCVLALVLLSLGMLAGQPLTAQLGPNGNIMLTDVNGQKAYVDKADVDATNGVVHLTNGINVPKPYTDAYTSFGVRCIIGANIPNNAGSLSVVRVTAPAGCILNAPFPLAVAARATVGQMLPDVVFGCLRQARPGKVPAEGTSCLWNIRLAGGQGGQNTQGSATKGRRFTVVGFNTGGTGARPAQDGLSVTSFPSGVRNVSLEIMETISPLVFWRKEYRPDSGGAGRAQGGDDVGHRNPRRPVVNPEEGIRGRHPPIQQGRLVEVDDAVEPRDVESLGGGIGRGCPRRQCRKRGEEDLLAHERKGVAGDWRNYFTPGLARLFRDRFGETLVAFRWTG